MLNHVNVFLFVNFPLCVSSLIHSIATRVIKLAHAKSSHALAPALVETYSRLLVYMEIESLGIKGFISQYFEFSHHFYQMILEKTVYFNFRQLLCQLEGLSF